MESTQKHRYFSWACHSILLVTGLLLEIIAKAVNMVPDQLIGNLGDVHLYNNHIEQAKEQISRTPYKLPKLNINTEFWPYEGGECGRRSH